MNDEVQHEHKHSPEYLAYYGEEQLVPATGREVAELLLTGLAWGLLAVVLLVTASMAIWEGIVCLENLVARIH